MIDVYKDYPIQPYISPDRDLAREGVKPVPRRNMEPLVHGLTAGDIILLWRIGFGTFTTETWFPKYFEYTYGINGEDRLDYLIKQGLAYEETAFDSLDHVKAADKKTILKAYQVKGLSKMAVAQLDQALVENLTEEELATYFTVRGIALTDLGQQVLSDHQAVVDRHPQKKF